MQCVPAPQASPSVSSTRERRLAQIQKRDPEAEGVFWYSVVTTGVYCRPTCPARNAHPANIRLHDTLEEARGTGFRACARCRPEEPSYQDRRRRLVQTVCALIEEPGVDLSSRALAARVGLSASHLHRLFRRETGMTPRGYIRARRAAGPGGYPGSLTAQPTGPGRT